MIKTVYRAYLESFDFNIVPLAPGSGAYIRWTQWRLIYRCPIKVKKEHLDKVRPW